jgi:hypothetical protein
MDTKKIYESVGNLLGKDEVEEYLGEEKINAVREKIRDILPKFKTEAIDPDQALEILNKLDNEYVG